ERVPARAHMALRPTVDVGDARERRGPSGREEEPGNLPAVERRVADRLGLAQLLAVQASLRRMGQLADALVPGEPDVLALAGGGDGQGEARAIGRPVQERDDAPRQSLDRPLL